MRAGWLYGPESSLTRSEGFMGEPLTSPTGGRTTSAASSGACLTSSAMAQPSLTSSCSLAARE